MISINKLFFILINVVLSGVIIIGGAVLNNVISSKIDSIEDKIQKDNLYILSNTIRNHILTGDNIALYSLIKANIDKGIFTQIKITDSNDKAIICINKTEKGCSQNNLNNKIKNIIYYDNSKKTLLAEIEGQYKTSHIKNVRNSINKISLASIITLVILINLIFYFLLNFYKNSLKIIIRYLTDTINNKHSKLDESIIKEVSAVNASLKKISNLFRSNIKKVKNMGRKEAYIKIAKQVEHDIRSPLNGLKDYMYKLEINRLNPEDKKVLEVTIERFEEILSDLSDKNIEKEYIIPEVEINNIFIELKNVKKDIKLIYKSDKNLKYIKFPKAIFKRIISNLVNNSIEASLDKGRVIVEINENNEVVEIKVSDNGVGIPKSKQKKIYDKGFTYNKKNGSGLGLSYVKEQLNEYNAKIELLESKEGASFKLTFKNESNEIFLKNAEYLKKAESLVVLDNDESVLNMWKEINPKCRVYEDINKVKEDYINGKIKEYTYVVDYDLGKSTTGFEFIKTLDKADKKNVVLCTSYFYKEDILVLAYKHKIKVYPKQAIPYIK